MTGWDTQIGHAIGLPLENVDTDQIIPARFMSQPRADGYEDFLFHDVRRNKSGHKNPAFLLNRHSHATVLVCGKNFGCGSSREAAAYALYDAGIRVIVSTSIADIFSANAVNNGLLPAIVSVDDCDALLTLLGSDALACDINLQDQTVSIGEHTVRFDIDSGWKTKLLHGWDDIDLTLSRTQEIKQYREQRLRDVAWAWPMKSTDIARDKP